MYDRQPKKNKLSKGRFDIFEMNTRKQSFEKRIPSRTQVKSEVNRCLQSMCTQSKNHIAMHWYRMPDIIGGFYFILNTLMIVVTSHLNGEFHEICHV